MLLKASFKLRRNGDLSGPGEDIVLLENYGEKGSSTEGENRAPARIIESTRKCQCGDVGVE